MADKCEFCGQPLVDGACLNPECDLSDFAPAISDRADLSEDTFLPDLDFDEDFDLEQDEFLPEVSDDGPQSSDGPDQVEEVIAERPVVSEELSAVPEISADISDSPEVSIEGISTDPALSNEGTILAEPEFDQGSGEHRPYLSLEQAAIPIDHTGTIMFEGNLAGGFHTQAELIPDENATRLTDDEAYRVIRTVLRESVSESADSEEAKEDETGNAKSGLTGRPEVSRTIRVQNPAETHRTLHRLPSRDLSVPSDSASLEKRKKKAESEEYSLDSKDYTIVDKVGEGGSGVVYKARQIALGRTVALKVLKQRRMKAGSRSRTRTKELEKRKGRFLHEVHITARLQHPNIIPLYDLGMNSHGEVFYSMKLIDESSEAGEEVQQSWASMVRVPVKRGSTEQIEKNVAIFSKVCDAMRYAHAEKIVHRDLKPDNVMVGQFGEVLVIDWGMALDLSKGVQPFTAGGTTSYMPPEMGLHYLKQSEMHKISHKMMLALGETRRDVYVESVLDHGTGEAARELLRDSSLGEDLHHLCRELIRLDAEERKLAGQVNFSSDIYLLGAILYEIAVGHPPHFVPQDSCKSIEEKHHREFWLSSNHKIQRLVQINDPLRLSLCNIALKALEKDQQDRFQSVEELQEAIQGFNRQVQSFQLVATGREALEKAQGGEGYQYLLPALESFRGAQSLWPEGEDARKLQTEAACEYARRADSRKDFDAGLSILDEYTDQETSRDQHVVTLASRLKKGKRIARRNRILAAVGWVAAVVLPLIVIGFSFVVLQDLEDQKKSAEIAKVTAEKNKAQAEADKQLAEQAAEMAAEDARLAAVAAQKAEQDKRIAEQAVRDADAAKLAAQETQMDAEEAARIAQEKSADAQEKARLATAALIDAEAKQLAAQQALEQAEMDTEMAKLETEKAERLAKFVKAQSSEDKFKSLLLPIPLDIRKGELEQAKQRLQTLRNDADLSPQFKNGWVAAHFAKVVNVEGLEKKLGGNTSVIDVLHRVDGSLITVGLKDGKHAVWETDSTSETPPRLLDAELPDYGRVSHAAISPNGKWLALALDNVVDAGTFHEHFWLIDLDSGRRAWIPTETISTATDSSKNDRIVGCKLIGFTESNSDQGMALVTVEELDAYYGLSQRLQIASRDVSIQSDGIVVGIPTTTAINATSRDQSKIRSLAAMNRVAGRTAIAIVYQSLDLDGKDKFVMESLLSDEQGRFSGQQTDIQRERYPTAIHVGTQGEFYCGYADGKVGQYPVSGFSGDPAWFQDQHESPVTILSSTSDGQVVSGSRDGVMILFDKQLRPVKRLIGQPDALTSASIANHDEAGGFQLVSGGAEGWLRVWNPSGTTHDAAIQKAPTDLSQSADGALNVDSEGSVTCGTVDQHYVATQVPASAYGTTDGTVVYFDPVAMRTDAGSKEIPVGAEDISRTSISPPPGSFDSTFANFDSFGIVEDQFVLLQDDGNLFVTRIDRVSKIPSADLDLIDATAGQERDPGFVPLVASQPNHPYFFSTDPTDASQILFWNRIDGLRLRMLQAGNQSKGRVKRMSLSIDGKWLAVVREVSGLSRTGEYVTEVFEVQNSGQPLRFNTTTLPYRVGDPAFVGFSANSRQLLLNFHRLGDRETWIENWNLADNRWQRSEDRQRIDDRRVDLVGWDGDDLMVTKINGRFYLASQSGEDSREIGRLTSQGNTRNRLLGVRPTGSVGSVFTLFNDRLGRYDQRGDQAASDPTLPFSNAGCPSLWSECGCPG